jgi:hypothetical protein
VGYVGCCYAVAKLVRVCYGSYGSLKWEPLRSEGGASAIAAAATCAVAVQWQWFNGCDHTCLVAATKHHEPQGDVGAGHGVGLTQQHLQAGGIKSMRRVLLLVACGLHTCRADCRRQSRHVVEPWMMCHCALLVACTQT